MSRIQWSRLGSARSPSELRIGARLNLNERGCEISNVLGTCVVDAAASVRNTLFSGDDQSLCAETAAACETFAAGIFTPSTLCEGGDDENDSQPSVIGGAVFQRMNTFVCHRSMT